MNSMNRLLWIQEGFTALHIAVQSGYEKVVEALLGMGAAVQLKAGKFGETPLHTASRIPNGRLCVEMLIKSGAQINAIEDVRQKSSEIPFHLSIINDWILILFVY